MKKMFRSVAVALVLAFSLIGFTGCTSECRTPFCTNNSQFTSDLCRRCNDLLDGVTNFFN